jgi:hypothetical protein
VKRAAAAWCAWIGLVAALAGGCASPNADKASTASVARPEPQNVILVTLDGMRWQEVFGGFDPLLATKEAGGVGTPAAVERLKKSFARDSAEESRAAVMPFFWGVVAKQGQVFGDRGVKNVGRVTNPYKFSYPGYNELLCGFPDPRINKNEYPPNPNVTVLEWLNGLPGFEGRVAAYGAWTRLHEIVNDARAGFPTFAGWQPIRAFNGAPLSDRERVLNDLLARSTQMWPDEAPDSFIQEAAIEYVTRHKPRVFYVSLGETDEWAHMRRYDLYLESARRADDFIKRLWETIQSMPEYAGKTSLVITTDHGRGGTPKDWTDHGAKVPGADGWWAAVMGPKVEGKGVIGAGEVTQGQIAATVAALVGQDYAATQPKAAAALPVIRR